MKLFIFALLVLAVTATSLDWEQFQSFKVKYGKTYANQVEEVKRFNIFKENLAHIEENNAKFEQGLVSFELGVNKYTDWTNEEFMEYFNIKPMFSLEKLEEQFQAFKVNYGKTYANQEEEEKRFNIFKENLKIIEENNAEFEKGLVSYELGVNKYSDWTNEEFKEYFHMPAILPENPTNVKLGKLNSLEREQFEAFKVEFGKTYADQEEEEKRFNIFKKNLKFIEENNAKFEKGLVSYELGINNFSDWTTEEFDDFFHVPKKDLGSGKLFSLDRDQFQRFKVKYGKTYASQEEEEKRFNIFKENHKIIIENNFKFEKGLVSYKLGVNKYSDLTNEEFKELIHLPGLKPQRNLESEKSLDREQFEAFKVQYGKTYADQKEEEKRFNIFKENLAYIEENNTKFEKGLVSYELGVNKYSDLTNEEFREFIHLPGLKPQRNLESEKSLDREQFEAFKVQYGKTYADQKEEEKRFNIFKENLAYIEENNTKFEKGLVSYELGVNKYSDLTNEEFREFIHLPGLKPQRNLESEKSLDREQFEAFKVQYGKTYADQKEEEKRFNIFKENLAHIEENNAKFEKGLVSYELGVNKYSDLTNEEFREFIHLPGLKPQRNLESEKSLDKEQFEAFKVQYGKTYADQKEEEKRFNIFKENLAYIEENNAKFEKGLVSYELGVNKYSDLTNEEFKEFIHLPGLKPQRNLESEKSLDREQFEAFKVQYGKTYADQKEEEKRFNIFKENLAYIEENNAKFEKGLVSYELGVNKYSDLTNEEFREFIHLPGLKPQRNLESEKSVDREQFEAFKVKYGKTYADQEEDEKRFNIFKENLKIIEENNAEFEKGLVSYRLGVNKYSDLTNEEFKELIHLPGIKPKKTEKELEWDEFQSYEVKYGKHYANQEEEEKRFNIFEENLKIIEENNALYKKGLVSYEEAVNDFTDKTEEEIKTGLLH